MKVTIVGQIKNRQTGLGKAINDFQDYCEKEAEKVMSIDITDNKKFFYYIYLILKVNTDVFYFTPSGSVGGNIRDSIYLLLMILKRKKIVTHFHNSAFGKVVNKNKILRIINKSIYQRVDKIIILGHKSKIMFEPLMIPNEKFEIIRNGIDGNLFISEEDLEAKQKSKPINIIYFSNMLKEKGYDIVLDLATNMQSNSNYHFYFSGKFFDVTLENEFKHRISTMGNVTYFNGVYGEEKEQLLKKMHYFILPTSYKDETLPISMLEAMANALYIIVSDVGVISEVVNKETTTLLPTIKVDTPLEIQHIIEATIDSIQDKNFKIVDLKYNFSNDLIQKRIFGILEGINF